MDNMAFLADIFVHGDLIRGLLDLFWVGVLEPVRVFLTVNEHYIYASDTGVFGTILLKGVSGLVPGAGSASDSYVDVFTGTAIGVAGYVLVYFALRFGFFGTLVNWENDKSRFDGFGLNLHYFLRAASLTLAITLISLPNSMTYPFYGLGSFIDSTSVNLFKTETTVITGVIPSVTESNIVQRPEIYSMNLPYR